MFDHSVVWRNLNYKERLVASIMFLELSQAGGVKYVDSKLVWKETCLNNKDFDHTCESLFKRDLLDVDETGDKLCLKGSLEDLFEEAVLKHRRQ